MSPRPLRYVLFEGARSAEPPTRNGTSAASAFITVPHAPRVATGFSGSNAGSLAARSSGMALA